MNKILKSNYRKRILHIVDGFRMGGAENKLMEMIDQLDRSKYEITLVNVGPGGPLQEQFEQLDVELFYFPRRWAFDPRPCWQLYRLMRKKQIDIVQTTLFWADVIGTVAAKCAGVPVVLSWETVSHEGDPYHNNFQRRFGYRLLAKQNNLIVAVSHEVKTSLIKQRKVKSEKIRVIHYGVNLSHYHPNGNGEALSKRDEFKIKPDDFLIGIVGRIEPRKGHSVFVQAFAEIAPRFLNAKVLFIGDGSCRNEIEELVNEKSLNDRCHFGGIRKDVVELLNNIDLFVLPSLNGEGLPNVLLEAMACQKPVISTDVGGIPELVRNDINGYVVPAGDSKALQSVLEKVIGNPELLHHLGKNALNTVQSEFSLSKQIKAFEEIYDNNS